MNIDAPTRERIESIIASHDVTLFMKGERDAPQCGFSSSVVRILDTLIPEYGTFDVLADPEIREGIKVYSSWPTVPQLYVRGEFVGGCDIIQELFSSGELHETLGVSLAEAKPPNVRLAPGTAAALIQAVRQAGAGDRELHLNLDARNRASLQLAPVAPGETSVDLEGVTLYLDPMSASRADGVVIEAIETAQGTAFRVDHPGAASVGSMTVEDLKRALDANEPFELLDVRTPEERERARIEASVLLTEEEAKRLEGLPRDTKLVFHCHHGGRSQAAAEHFASLGFTNAHNVVGGIEAWSQQIDPDIPRY